MKKSNKRRKGPQKKENSHHKPVSPIPSPTDTIDIKHVICLLLITALSFIAYLPTLKNNFTNWDETAYILQNPFIQELSFANIKAIFSQYYMSNYHPLTLLSLALDFQIGSLEPWIYHFVNIVLHLINTMLVFQLVRMLFKHVELALICASLFGVHTLHVESVAWAAQRKDLLYTLFFLFSLMAYVTYTKNNERKYYLYALIFFFLSILSKGMAVSLPLVLIAVDMLHNRGLLDKKIIAEKLPFFLLSLVFGIIAIHAQSGEAVQNSVGYQYRFYERIFISCYGFTQYLFKLIWPVKLSAIYPYPDRVNGLLPATFWLSPIPVLAVLGGTVVAFKRMKPVAFGLLFFIINIFLVLQWFPVGNAIMADRYSYLSSTGIFLVMGIAYIRMLEKKPDLRIPIHILLVIYIISLSVLTYNRCQVWQDSASLWNDVLLNYPDELTALNGRGIARRTAGDFKGAMADYNKIIRKDPDRLSAYINRGTTRIYMGDLKGALEDYNRALHINPEYAEVYAYKGFVKNALKDYAGAIADCNRAIKEKSDAVDAFLTRGSARHNLGDSLGAISDFSRVIELQPENQRAYFNRGMARLAAGEKRGGCTDLLAAQHLGFKEADRMIKQYCINPRPQ